ncbi:hypothetical protein, partial [Pseudomonas sp. PS02285]|uniref:hypothetical protein n=1 Tax=Pseudomonas sp. PS02285 TaxID=2991441 RepID=UPI00249A6A4C
ACDSGISVADALTDTPLSQTSQLPPLFLHCSQNLFPHRAPICYRMPQRDAKLRCRDKFPALQQTSVRNFIKL